MAGYKVIYESQESILGHLTKSREWIRYKGALRITDGGKTPVTLDMTFSPPHPFPFNMPDTHRIQSKSVTEVYAKLVKFFRKFGIEFEN
jgi:hypothetical protein